MITFQYSEPENGAFRFIANDGKHQVAHAVGFFDGNDIVLDNIAVDPPYRNTQDHIGGTLLQKVIDLGREKGSQHLRGEMKPEYGLHIEQTKKFYERNGVAVNHDNQLFMDLGQPRL